MTYDDLEAATAEGRPYFLYLFAENSSAWRFTSRAADWVSPAGVIHGQGGAWNWTASPLSHGSVVQSGDPRRTDLSVTFPISDPFARRWLGPRGHRTTTLTIFRGHEQVPDEVVAHWKGRVVSARTEGARILLRCESLFTSMRREGVRAKYQRLCRRTPSTAAAAGSISRTSSFRALPRRAPACRLRSPRPQPSRTAGIAAACCATPACTPSSSTTRTTS